MPRKKAVIEKWKAHGGRWENRTVNDRDLFSLSPSHRARVLYFSFSQPPNDTKGPLRRTEVGHYEPQTKNKRFKPLKIVLLSENQ